MTENIFSKGPRQIIEARQNEVPDQDLTEQLTKFVLSLHLQHWECVNKIKERPHVQCKHSEFRGFGYNSAERP